MKTLHLVLKGHWYDKIASGEKTSEYRACTPYWNKRLTDFWRLPATQAPSRFDLVVHNSDKFDRVIFHRGYTATTMEFEIKYIKTTTKPNDLNLDHCWEIKLGKRIK